MTRIAVDPGWRRQGWRAAPLDSRIISRHGSRCTQRITRQRLASLSEPGHPAAEDVAINGPARTQLARPVHDAGWASFVHMLEYKARLPGREFRRITRKAA